VSAPDCRAGLLKAIEALDAQTVRFVLCAPDPGFLSKIAFPVFGIQPREWLEQTGGGGEGSLLLEKPVGTGPYRVQEWVKGERLVFQAFDSYWGGRPGLSTLVFRWNSDPGQRLLELQTGTVDGIDDVIPTDFATIQANPALALVSRPALNTSYIGINNTVAPFDQEKVRQAVAMAIDRRMLVEKTFPSGYEVAQYFAPCSIPFACGGDGWYEFNPKEARQLLDEAGLAGGFQTQLYYRDVPRGYLPRPDLAAKELQDQLFDNLRIQVKIVKADTDTYFDQVDGGLIPGLYLLGWGADFPEITNFLDPHFGVGASQQFGNKYSDLVDILNQGASGIDAASRQAAYQAANNAIRQHVPLIPLSHGGWVSMDSTAVAFRKEVEAVHASPLGLESFASMAYPGQSQLTWMQKAEPLSLYCADETDIESLRACSQVTESLYSYEPGGVAVRPGLAEACTPAPDLATWTCTLRKAVQFHDGSWLDANDVVMSFWVQWDVAHPLHKGHTGAFDYFKDFFKGFLGAPGP
jgi:peptide/nickel transport system substrate-binding protein